VQGTRTPGSPARRVRRYPSVTASLPANGSGELAGLLQRVPASHRAELTAGLEVARTQTGLPAAYVWGPVLHDPALRDLRDVVLRFLVDDGGPSAEALVAGLRDGARAGHDRSTCQAALLRLTTGRVGRASAPPPPGARAQVSTPDGQGAFILWFVLPAPDGRSFVSAVCLRATGGVRDVVTERSQDVEGTLARLQAGHERLPIDLTDLPVGDATRLVDEAERRMPGGLASLGPDGTLLLGLLERLPRADPHPFGGSVAPLDQAGARRLLSTGACNAWFLDRGDLDGYGIATFPLGLRFSGWVESAARKLATTPVRERLLGMVRQMVAFHGWSGEEEEEMRWRGVLASLESDFGSSPFLHEILRRSPVPPGPSSRRDDSGADDDVRERVRASLFSSVTRPVGRDLAHLDFAEIAAVALSGCVDGMAGEVRPREKELHDMAFVLAEAFVGIIETGVGKDAKWSPKAVSVLAGLASAAGLSRTESKRMADDLATALTVFAGTVCLQCPFSCLGRLRDPLPPGVFEGGHPASKPRGKGPERRPRPG